MKNNAERIAEIKGIVKEAKTQNCVTHHYACECREAKFKQIKTALKAAIPLLEEHWKDYKVGSKSDSIHSVLYQAKEALTWRSE
jgi:hypothetical protein